MAMASAAYQPIGDQERVDLENVIKSKYGRTRPIEPEDGHGRPMNEYSLGIRSEVRLGATIQVKYEDGSTLVCSGKGIDIEIQTPMTKDVRDPVLTIDLKATKTENAQQQKIKKIDNHKVLMPQVGNEPHQDKVLYQVSSEEKTRRETNPSETEKLLTHSVLNDKTPQRPTKNKEKEWPNDIDQRPTSKTDHLNDEYNQMMQDICIGVHIPLGGSMEIKGEHDSVLLKKRGKRIVINIPTPMSKDARNPALTISQKSLKTNNGQTIVESDNKTVFIQEKKNDLNHQDEVIYEVFYKEGTTREAISNGNERKVAVFVEPDNDDTQHDRKRSRCKRKCTTTCIWMFILFVLVVEGVFIINNKIRYRKLKRNLLRNPTTSLLLPWPIQ